MSSSGGTPRRCLNDAAQGASVRILAIDPGTHCGYAIIDDGKIITSGTWNLSSRRHEGGGMRFLRLENHLSLAIQGVGLVAYEEVRRHLGTDAAHIYGGIVAMIQTVAERAAIPYYAIPVATVKKFATGKGNAKKDAMVAAGAKLWGQPLPEDETDARFIGLAAHDEFQKSKGGI